MSKYIYQTLFLSDENSDIKMCEQNKLIDKIETDSGTEDELIAVSGGRGGWGAG